jgi:hypothetical protein
MNNLDGHEHDTYMNNFSTCMGGDKKGESRKRLQWASSTVLAVVFICYLFFFLVLLTE